MKKVVALLSSSLDQNIKFHGIIDRDDIVVIITREMVKKALKEYENIVETHDNICEVWRLMNENGADIILLDDRNIDPDDWETKSFYYRCD
jgi:predicted transcriptional regulator